MRRLTTLLFAISLFASSCGSGLSSMKPTGSVIENTYFSNPETDYVYRTSIEIYGHDLGGILIIKKTSQGTHRLVLTTDFGNKLIDATMTNGVLTVNSIVEEFDRKLLIRTLEKDFSVILRDSFPIYSSDATDVQHFSIIGDESYEIIKGLHGIEKIVRSKRKPKAEYTFKAENDIFAHEIHIRHFDLKLEMDLKSLKPTEK
ncbi:hypothetical protein [Flavobacterium silvaticum]|uniref:DUF4292 domain-containing protein n=1 Tax=Flavobacterium silvaticum TaxID=1852020 RepID=A0A972JI11_9FLAO|nr:hypothetical protein [Flavobacterium silvaticum]NMH27703.1 hypothetical protein [Flavobacterium silvaticum]